MMFIIFFGRLLRHTNVLVIAMVAERGYRSNEMKLAEQLIATTPVPLLLLV